MPSNNAHSQGRIKVKTQHGPSPSAPNPARRILIGTRFSELSKPGTTLRGLKREK